MLEICGYLGLGCTFYMTGIVWFAQVVHYPLLDRCEPSRFPAFALDYQRRTMWVVLPGLAGEIASAVLLIWLWPGPQTYVGFAVLGAVWVSTYFWVIPAHLNFKLGYDAEVHRSLVRRNLPRALLWTLRAAIMVWTVATLP